MARVTYDDLVDKHGPKVARFIQEISHIQRTSTIMRRASLAKALLNAFYKGILAADWIAQPQKTMDLLEEKAKAYPREYKVFLRRPDTGKELGPDNWYLQGVKPNDDA